MSDHRPVRLRFSLRSLLLFALLCAAGAALAWHWQPWALERAVKARSGYLHSVEFSADGKFILAVGSEPFIQYGGAVVFDAGSGEIVRKIPNDKDTGRRTLTAAIAPDSNTIALGTTSGIELWSLKNGRVTSTITGPSDLLHLFFSCDGKRLAGLGPNGLIDVWDTGTGADFASFNQQKGSSFAAFSSDGSTLATVGFDDNIHIWSLQHHTSEVLIQREQGMYFWSAIFSADSKTLYTAGDPHNPVRAWDAATGQPRPLPALEQLPRLCKEMSPDNSRMILPTDDSTEMVWDTKHGRELTALPVQGVMSTAFSPDGTRIVTGSDDTLRIWRLRRPEGAAGLLVLPELWCAAALLPGLLWSLFRDRRPKLG